MVGCLVRDPVSPSCADGLEGLARACSPRVEPHGPDAVLFDVDGLTRMWGTPDVIARDVLALSAGRGLTVRLALAPTRTAAWILAHVRAGVTLVPPGEERSALAGVPLDTDTAGLPGLPGLPGSPGAMAFLSGPLGPTAADPPGRARVTGRRRDQARARAIRLWADALGVFVRWGLHTLGDLAALPRGEVHARLGALGVRLHQAACGEDVTPLVAQPAPEPWVECVELEWPIDGLEPLSFVLARQFDRLAVALARADRGAVTIGTRLTLCTRETHVRVLHLPAPMRDARILRTLVLLDLESHPPAAGIDRVELALEVLPGRIVQGSLLERAQPSAETPRRRT